MTAAEVVTETMQALAAKRPIFHSEADFQHALAWEIQLAHETAAIRLEKRVSTAPRVIELDLLIQLSDRRFGVELKYLRNGMSAEVDGELFTLSTGADDHGRYWAIEDCARLERLVSESLINSGALVLLTNSPSTWTPSASPRPTLYDAFRMHDGHTLTGTMEWGTGGAVGGRPGSGTIALTGSYPLLWRDYSTVGGKEFRYLVVDVGGGP